MKVKTDTTKLQDFLNGLDDNRPEEYNALEEQYDLGHDDGYREGYSAGMADMYKLLGSLSQPQQEILAKFIRDAFIDGLEKA